MSFVILCCVFLQSVDDVQLLVMQASALALDPRLGATALHIACNRGSTEIVKLLLAEVNVNTELKDRSGTYITTSMRCSTHTVMLSILQCW